MVFPTLASVILDTQALSDLELQSYLASLDPNQAHALATANINTVRDQVSAVKATNFTNANQQLIAADNSITAAAYYLLRTQDLQQLATDVNDVTTKQATEISINKELANRQYEINEWSNSNKMDTLYFLQVLFISLTLSGVLLFLMKNGLLPSYLFGLFSFLIVVFAIIVLLLRWRFTAVKRDGTYWNKQRWGQPSS
jgi:hypothetical protein